MAYTAKDFEKDLALYSAGAIIGVTRSRKFLEYAAKKGIQLAAFTAPNVGRVGMAGARGLAGFAARRPRTAAAIGTVAAQQLGAFDPVAEAIEMEVERRVEEIQRGGANPLYGTLEDFVKAEVPKRAKRKVSKYAKSVKAGMAAVKSSKFGGKPGRISKPKAAFKTVNLVASAVNKGKKVATTGIRGVVARAVRKIL